MVISEQEKKRILEMHQRSGYRTLIVEQEASPKDLFTKGDRDGLYKLALSTDSESIKSNPVYKNTLEWWLRGQGKVNPLLGEKGRKQTDVKQSLRSLYRWVGGDDSEGVTSSSTQLDKYLNFFDQIIQKKADIIKSNPTLFNEDKFKKFEENIKVFKQYKESNIIFIKPELLIVGNIDTLIGNLNKNNFTDLNKTIDAFPNKTVEYTNQYKNKKGGLWSIKKTISDNDKISILKSIQDSSQNYWNKNKKIANDLGGVVDIATDLYIAGKGENLGASTTSSEPKSITIVGGYPGEPKGVGSPEWVESNQMFPDDGTTITEQAKLKLNEEVKKAVDYAKSTQGKITSISIKAFSSTSQVPTKYGSDTNQFSPDNNIKLAQDRLNAINSALSEAFKANGVEITPKVEGNEFKPNQGPPWTDNERKDTTKWGVKGRRTQQYQEVYGNWRYSRGFFKLTIETTEAAVQQTVQANSKTNWNVIISWAKEGMKINPPNFKTYTNGNFDKWDGQCPYFK